MEAKKLIVAALAVLGLCVVSFWIYKKIHKCKLPKVVEEIITPTPEPTDPEPEPEPQEPEQAWLNQGVEPTL